MLDRLLYQAHVKNYVVHFVRLFLGIVQSKNSGYLIIYFASFSNSSSDCLISTDISTDIPIGI
ncbi:unnamed protein product [Brugia pahangi]|uniref:Ovule protein n=1 Tax=Brugia pahangi TaxID=6280 RepID=A0A0N4T1H8_BRUPA|nr:unnamed protein product [Brugia pahangi]